jgi:hypothetical protein
MPNRYQRDELIRDALDMAQVVSLKNHDCPNGVVQQNAYTINWLQDIIDFWYHMVPFSAGVTLTQLNIPALAQSIALPTNFILDVRDGYILQRSNDDVKSKRRLKRLTLQKWLSTDLYYQSQPACPMAYMIQGSTIKVTPMNDIARQAWLWYYFLPPVIQSDEVPIFPNDYVIKQYLFIRAREWSAEFEPGTAEKFANNHVKSMKASGLFNEPEDDIIPLERDYHYSSERSTYAWMGER